MIKRKRPSFAVQAVTAVLIALLRGFILFLALYYALMLQGCTAAGYVSVFEKKSLTIEKNGTVIRYDKTGDAETVRETGKAAQSIGGSFIAPKGFRVPSFDHTKEEK